MGNMWAKDTAQQIRRVLSIASTIAGLAIGVRMTGLLQLLELSAFDQFFLLRPFRQTDERILIVGVDEQDLRFVGDWPIPDGVLAELLNKIKAQNPKAIGLDIYRDIPVEPGNQELVEVFDSTPNLIGITKVVGQQVERIPPPPALKNPEQIGANDLPYDLDGKIRRAFLYLDDRDGKVVYSFGFKLAWIYLADLGIRPKMKDDIRIQLGQAVFEPLSKNDGSYVRTDSSGYQIFLNYLGPNQTFQIVSLRDVLTEKIPPDLMRDRIVMVGSTAISIKDFLLTPYSSTIFRATPEPMAGVEVHAHVTSQLISAALEGRSLIKTWPEAIEWVWIFAWALVGATLTCKWRSKGDLNQIVVWETIIRIPLSAICLGLICYIAFLVNWWIPLVPPFLSLLGATTFTICYTLWENLLRSHKQLEEYARTLEIKVEYRTQELREKNSQLQQTLEQLKSAQKQIVAQEKLAYLGSLTAGIAHEIRNPLNFINNFAQISGELTEELSEELKSFSDELAAESLEYIDDILSDLKNSVTDIESNGKRIETIVQSMMMHTPTQKGHRQMTNLNSLLSESIELAYNSHLAKENRYQITIETDYDRSIGDIDMIPQDMARAFVNILKNACDAVNERKKALGEQFQPIISVKTLNQEDSAKIYIRDNGIGIPDNIIDQIFNPFFTTKPPGEGTGLGLSLSYDTIVGEHQGDIQVNIVDKATEFMIVLPKKPWHNL